MDQLAQEIEPIFEQQNQVDLPTVLTPISQADPTGECLHDDPLYQRIQDARLTDDISTPRGVWELELKHADWDLVYTESFNAIRTRSKDLQLAVWCLEAQLMRLGFVAIGPGIYMITRMVETFWGSLHPQATDGDMDHSINIFEWINTKLAIALKQVPLTHRVDAEKHYNWADWELAMHHSQIENAHPELAKNTREDDLDTIALNINLTPIEYYQQLYADIELALLATDHLAAVLDEKLDADSPSLAGFTGVLEEIAGVAFQQLEQRGKLPIQSGMEMPSADNIGGIDLQAERMQGDSKGLTNRGDAYLALQSIADYLRVDDPHSPAPYLIYKAIAWGGMDTAQLYSELFVKQQGHINIFEILGIDASPEEAQLQ